MLYFFYGTDAGQAREEARARVAALQKQNSGAAMFKIDAENFSAEHFGDLIGGQGLFNKAHLVSCASLFENEEAKEFFLQRISDIADSPTIFVLAEGEVDAETLRTVTTAAEKTHEFKKRKALKFNVFSLADALASRDKKNLWVLYHKALREGFAPENITGTLFWKVKSMLTAPYPSRLWSADELRNLSGKIVTLYHDSHRGIHDFEIALERLILSV